jgi:Mn-dependent DtxR family transcriptional regulator
MKPIRQTKSVKILLASIQATPDQRLSISYQDLSSLLFISVRSAQKLIKRLESASLLKIERDTNQFKPNTYSINNTYYQLLEEQL